MITSIDDTDREIGRLDGRMGSLEDQFSRFHDKLDRIDATLAQLSVNLAEHRGSIGGTARMVGMAIALLAMLGTWLAPVAEKLLHKN